MAPGVVTVHVGEANGLKETEFLGTQDPYAVVTIGGQKHKTKVHKDGGKRASWNESFQWTVNTESDLTLEVFNKNSMSKDDLIGAARYSLAKAFSVTQDSCWINISRGGHKQSGQVYLNISFQPLPAAGYGAAPVFGAPANVWPPGGMPVGQGGYPQPGGAYPPPQGYFAPPAAYPPQGAAYPPPEGAYPPPAGGAFVPQGVPAGYNPPPPSGYPVPGSAGPPQGYHSYAPPPAGYPAPSNTQTQQQHSGTSNMNAVYAGLAGAALGAGATGAYVYTQHGHGHNKHGKHKQKGYKHKGHKHKGYKHKGHKHKGYKHKGFGKKWKKK